MLRMYKIQTTGTRNPTISPNPSAKAPNKIGIKAPPIMAVIINPDSSFALSGILSIVIEKISGKILANPRPIIIIEIIPEI